MDLHGNARLTPSGRNVRTVVPPAPDPTAKSAVSVPSFLLSASNRS